MARPRRQKGSLQKRMQGGALKWTALYYDEAGKRKFATLGHVSRMKKGTAESRLAELVAPVNERASDPTLKQFIEGTYLPFGRLKWKASTAVTNEQRIRTHLVDEIGHLKLSEFRRERMQSWLQEKARTPLEYTGRVPSHSLIHHLRWDLQAILDLAERDELVRTNQAKDLAVPRGLPAASKTVAAPADLMKVFTALQLRERLIVRMAALAGMRPGEVLSLTWGDVDGNRAAVRQRVYRGDVDSTKNDRCRIVALPGIVARELEAWKGLRTSADNDWLFPSATGRPGNRDSIWRHAICPVLKKIGLQWVTFQVMRRTWATAAAGAGIDAKVAADQLGHGVDVDINEYTQVEFGRKLAAVERVAGVFEETGRLM